MPYSRGDIVLVWFPNSDLVTFKRRPALVVQADNLRTGIPQVVIAMVTTSLQRSGHPSRVFIPISSLLGAKSGLVADSVVMTDNIATASEAAIDKTIGSLSDMATIDAALRHTLGL